MFGHRPGKLVLSRARTDFPSKTNKPFPCSFFPGRLLLRNMHHAEIDIMVECWISRLRFHLKMSSERKKEFVYINFRHSLNDGD